MNEQMQEMEALERNSDALKEQARNALRGKWKLAVLTAFAAALMGGSLVSSGNSAVTERYQDAFEFISRYSIFVPLLPTRAALRSMKIGAGLWMLVTLAIGGAGQLGYARFNLRLIDGEEASFSDIFSQFHRLWAGFCMKLLTTLYTLLWTLCFIVPGLIKTLSYAMTPYILSEHPEMTANEAITASKNMMEGHKWRLFCLGFSFIGWSLLCDLPVMISLRLVARLAAESGNPAVLWWLAVCGIPSFVGWRFLHPYQEAAYAAFYRDLAAKPET